MYKKIFLGGLFLLVLLGFTSGQDLAWKKAQAKESDRKKESQMIDYRKNMIGFIEQISIYAKNKKPSFQLIKNDGLQLFQYAPEKAGEKLLKLVDGVLLEGLYYTWRLDDFQRTNSERTRILETDLKIPQKHGITIFNIDYCDRVETINNSLKLNKRSNVIGFAASSRRLERIPKYPWEIPGENELDITALNQVKNFIALLNPGRFTAKQLYLNYIQDTNYDLLIIDMTYRGTTLSPEDVAFLKKKKNGGSRLVFSYMSIGEAENYRSYWQESWNTNPPEWLVESNTQWEGNYKIKYWSKEWQEIILGSDNSYLDTILAAGFDGVFLDVIDAYAYFEYKQNSGE